MNLTRYKLIFAVVGLIGIFLLINPAISMYVNIPNGLRYSEIYLLGPQHTEENYPFNTATGENYSCYIGIGNHMGSPTYYEVLVKIRNLTDSPPDNNAMVPCPANILHEYKFCLQDGAIWEKDVTFSITNALVSGDNPRIREFQIDGTALNMDKPIGWNVESSTFSYQLIFELWTYNSTLNAFGFNSRYVSLNLNFTKT
jgi:hypothetical protein